MSTYQEFAELIEKVRSIDPKAAEWLENAAGSNKGVTPNGNLMCVMPWDETPQGYTYWFKIKKALGGEMSYDFNGHADEAAKERIEIAKCPICGESPKETVPWVCSEKSKNQRPSPYISCCNFGAFGVSLWNQYAAAIELAKVCVAIDEAMRTDDDDDRIIELYENFCNAESCVLEVFK